MGLIFGALWVSRPDPPIPLAPAPAAAPVHVRTLAAEARPERLRAYGETSPVRHALLAADQSGLVRWRAPQLEVGEQVEAGQELLRLDAGRLEQQRAQAQAAVEVAEAQVELARGELRAAEAEQAAAAEAEPLARREAERQEQLAASGDVPESVRDRAQQAWVEARGRLQVAEAAAAAAAIAVDGVRTGVAQAQQNLAAVEDELSRVVVRAPFAGEIAQVHVEEGAWLAPGSPVAALVDRSSLRVRLSIPNGADLRIQQGARVLLEFPAFRLEDGTALQREVELGRLSPEAQPMSRARTLECVLPNQEDQLPAGAFVEATVMLGERRGIWLRPSEYRLDPAGARAVVVQEGRAELRPIRLGRAWIGADGSTWHPVLAGLRAGETIAIDNLESPVDGGPVLVLEDLPPTALR